LHGRRYRRDCNLPLVDLARHGGLCRLLALRVGSPGRVDSTHMFIVAMHTQSRSLTRHSPNGADCLSVIKPQRFDKYLPRLRRLKLLMANPSALGPICLFLHRPTAQRLPIRNQKTEATRGQNTSFAANM
jgi:hypothetical protein